ncbi:MAG: sterol desaturase family protein [Alphaproteobacteria bacterium]|nr:sterol desaturase family protein [Alphaproteobacteria bacterium]
MISFLLALAIVIATVAFMEGFAWWAHKYVMHGWGWGWHRSHHEPHDETFEKNDLYAVVFAGVAIVLFWVGTTNWVIWWIAVGITAYGALYFIAHDGLVHHRWPFRYVPKSGYFKRLYQAHRLHHAVKGKDGCVSFGFIWAPALDTLKQQLRQNQKEQDLTLYESERDTLAE